MAIVSFKLLLPIVLVIALLIVPSIEATSVHYCDNKGNYDVKVSGVKISPDPVIRGKEATFSISASTAQALEGGELVIEVSYFGLHIHTETHDLCSETTCPTSKGDFVISHSQALPGFTPAGKYSLKMKLFGKNNQQLTCICFDFQIKRGSSVAEI